MRSRRITLYRLATGAITANATVSEGVLHVYEERDLGWIDGHWPGALWRIDVTQDPHAPALLTAMPVTVSDNRIDDIPPGTQAIIDRTIHDIEDGSLIIELDLGIAEDVKVTLINPLWLQWEGLVPCQ